MVVYIQPPWSRVSNADISKIDWGSFMEYRKEAGDVDGYDAVLIDYPWRFGSSDPVRGAQIEYNTMSDEQILQIPLKLIVPDGFAFIWTIPIKEGLLK